MQIFRACIVRVSFVMGQRAFGNAAISISVSGALRDQLLGPPAQPLNQLLGRGVNDVFKLVGIVYPVERGREPP